LILSNITFHRKAIGIGIFSIVYGLNREFFHKIFKENLNLIIIFRVERSMAERATRETLGVIIVVLGILCIFVGPFLGYLDVAQSIGKGLSITSSIVVTFYIRWLLLLIIGLILRSKMIDMIHIMSSRRAVVYFGLILGLIMLGTLIVGLLREIHIDAVIVYLPFIINGSILMSYTKDLSKYK
jgi:hypothetical protein